MKLTKLAALLAALGLSATSAFAQGLCGSAVEVDGACYEAGDEPVAPTPPPAPIYEPGDEPAPEPVPDPIPEEDAQTN